MRQLQAGAGASQATGQQEAGPFPLAAAEPPGCEWAVGGRENVPSLDREPPFPLAAAGRPEDVAASKIVRVPVLDQEQLVAYPSTAAASLDWVAA